MASAYVCVPAVLKLCLRLLDKTLKELVVPPPYISERRCFYYKYPVYFLNGVLSLLFWQEIGIIYQDAGGA